MLTITQAAVIAAGGLAGGFVTGLAGFGTGLAALGFWLHVIEPAEAAILVAVCSVAGQLQTLPSVWRAIDPRRAGPMVIAGLAGVPLGTVLVRHLDIGVFRLAMGLFLIGFSGFMLFRRAETKLAWGGRGADAAIGLAGGILGGLVGLSGPLPTVWSTLRGWTKDERRSIVQVFNLTILAAVVLWQAASGLLTMHIGWLVAIALPGTLAGAWLGGVTYRRLSDHHFHRIVLILLAISGMTLVLASR